MGYHLCEKCKRIIESSIDPKTGNTDSNAPCPTCIKIKQTFLEQAKEQKPLWQQVRELEERHEQMKGAETATDIRATLLLNFGPGNAYGNPEIVHDEQRTFTMVFGLATRYVDALRELQKSGESEG